MKKLRERARKTASLVSSTLPYGEVVRIITAALKEQDDKYKDLFEACLPIKTKNEVSDIEKDIFIAQVNIDINSDEQH